MLRLKVFRDGALTQISGNAFHLFITRMLKDFSRDSFLVNGEFEVCIGGRE